MQVSGASTLAPTGALRVGKALYWESSGRQWIKTCRCMETGTQHAIDTLGQVQEHLRNETARARVPAPVS